MNSSDSSEHDIESGSIKSSCQRKLAEGLFQDLEIDQAFQTQSPHSKEQNALGSPFRNSNLKLEWEF